MAYAVRDLQLRLSDVKRLSCKMVLNKADADYAGLTIGQRYITMGTMLKSVLMNDLVAKRPMNGAVCSFS